MKFTLPLVLAATAAALPAAVDERQAASNATIIFSGLAIRSGSDFQNTAVNANGFQFWLNKPTATYCPSSVAPNCPTNTDQTLFSKTLSNSILSLDVEVPGGQQVYVASSGLLKYKEAHSAISESGAVTEGFVVAQAHLYFENAEWLACQSSGTTHTVYAASRYTGTTECLTFRIQAIQPGATQQAAWQYV